MQQYDAVMNNIVNLTSQRDSDLLALSLLKSVNEIVKTSKLSISCISNEEKPTYSITFDKHTNLNKNYNIPLENSLLQAFKLMKEHSLDEYLIKGENTYLYIQLLEHDRRGYQFLLINLSRKLNNNQAYSLNGILSIYKNFVSLLNESQTDELTGLANRKTFESSMSHIFDDSPFIDKNMEKERRLEKSIKNNIPPLRWIAIIDIDDFKKINDDFGHLYGDEILIHLSEIIRKSFREDDLQFRFGGEEFVIVLKSPSKEQSFKILDRFREEVENYDFPSVGQVTISIGVTEFIKGVFHVTLIDFADQALYFSKSKGKNCLHFFEDMLANGDCKLPETKEGEVDLF